MKMGSRRMRRMHPIVPSGSYEIQVSSLSSVAFAINIMILWKKIESAVPINVRAQRQRNGSQDNSILEWSIFNIGCSYTVKCKLFGCAVWTVDKRLAGTMHTAHSTRLASIQKYWMY